MIKAGYSRKKISSILGVSSGMVSIYFSVMRKRGFFAPKSHEGPEDKDLIEYRSKKIIEMNNNKFSKKEIAKELGLTVHGIHRHINLYLLDY
jgi:predicted transcriptional regulator